ncbi:MAG: T9SS type A sorting domain-containing protein, partial [Bacteroidales bacterium]|nr:T9SS type A sorting domain-containing protein [Bacteroidales bacterium]
PAERRDYAYQIYDPYGQTPRQNWVSSSSYGAFNIEVLNNGVNAVVPKVTVTVTSPSGDEIYTQTVTGRSIATGVGDTLDIATIDEENPANSTIFYFNVADANDIELGRYTITYTVFADGVEDDNNTNNTIVQYFDITDNNYSKSYFEPTFSACINCNVSSASGEDEYGTEFLYLYSPDDIMSIDVYINRLTRPGTAIKAALYARETDESNAQVVRLKRESEYYEITSEDIETWVNLTFENQYPFQFESGETYRQLYAMVCGSWDNQGDDIYLGASDVLTTRSHNSYVRHGSDLDENGEPTWYYGGQDIAITLHAGEGVNPGLVNAEQNVAEGIEMYPNPSNGIVNFTNVENATIEVYNMMGQVVASESNANANASIDLSGVANGNYIVRIVKDGEIATSKLNIVK